MTQPSIPSRGEAFASDTESLALAYGEDPGQFTQRVYALAEQIHRHYCLSRGIVNHSESRPDQHVAMSVLASLAGSDWWLVHAADRVRATGQVLEVPGMGSVMIAAMEETNDAPEG